MRPSKAQDERAQIHIFEMITLFWLFFMSALFVLRIHVPDPPTAAYDGTLAGAGRTRYALRSQTREGTTAPSSRPSESGTSMRRAPTCRTASPS